MPLIVINRLYKRNIDFIEDFIIVKFQLNYTNAPGIYKLLQNSNVYNNNSSTALVVDLNSTKNHEKDEKLN